MSLALARRGAAARRRGVTAGSLPISATNPNPTVTSTGSAPNVHGTQIAMPHDGQPHQGFPGLVKIAAGHYVAVYRSAARHSLTVRGGAGHGVILLAETTDYGETWTQRTIVDSPDLNDDRDPNLTWIASTSTWVLTYPTWMAPDNANSPPTGCRIHYRTSTDLITWSAETRITSADHAGFEEYLATTSPILVATDGQYVIPATGRLLAGQLDYSSVMLRATTLAGPWTATVLGNGPADARSYDEPYARKLADGSYLAFSRYGAAGVARYTSADGLTWNALTAPITTGAGGRPSFIQLANGAILLGTRGSETQNHVRFSRDAGVTWSTATDVPPVALRLATYLAFVEVSPNLVACVYSKEDTLENGRAYFRYILDGVEGTPPATLSLASSTTATYGSGTTSMVVNKPSGVVSGELLVLLVNQRATAAVFTPPTGWTQVGVMSNTGKTQVWYRVADGTEGTTFTVTSNTSANAVIGCLRFSNASTTTAPTFTSATGNSTTATTPAATVATGGSIVLGVFAGGNANQSNVVPPSGYTEVFDIRGAVSTTNPWMEVAQKDVASASTEPAASVTIPSSTWMAAAIVVAPA